MKVLRKTVGDVSYELHLVDTNEMLNRVFELLAEVDAVVVDLETSGLDKIHNDFIAGIALYIPDSDEAWYLSFGHGEGHNLTAEQLVTLIRVLETKIIIAYNSGFDMHFLYRVGLAQTARFEDVMTALMLLDENRHDKVDKRGLNYKLKDNARLYIDGSAADEQTELNNALKERGLKGAGNMWRLPAEKVYAYACMDVILTWRLRQFFMPFLEKWNQVDLYFEMNTFHRTLLRMERAGMLVDRNSMMAQTIEKNSRAGEILREIQTQAGFAINLNSSDQVRRYLGTSRADAATLEMLEENGDERAGKIQEYKWLSKGAGTFYKAYLKLSTLDGRVHPEFNLMGTDTGRLSCTKPNVQQVPRNSERYRIKDVFIAPEGYTFVQIDYAAVELRLACYFANQENMIIQFANGFDPHRYTAHKLFGVPLEQVTKYQRQVGKEANFSFTYGMGHMKAAAKLSSKLGKVLLIDRAYYEAYGKWKFGSPADRTWEEFIADIKALTPNYRVVDDAEVWDTNELSIHETRRILYAWRELYPSIVSNLKQHIEEASTFRPPPGALDSDEKHKYIQLEDGRVRHYIKGQNTFGAWNFRVQGTGAIVMRRALINIDREFPCTQDDLYIVASVHDSGIFYILTKKLSSILPRVVELMEDFPYHPALKVDVSIGRSWGELEDWKNE